MNLWCFSISERMKKRLSSKMVFQLINAVFDLHLLRFSWIIYNGCSDWIQCLRKLLSHDVPCWSQEWLTCFLFLLCEVFSECQKDCKKNKKKRTEQTNKCSSFLCLFLSCLWMPLRCSMCVRRFACTCGHTCAVRVFIVLAAVCDCRAVQTRLWLITLCLQEGWKWLLFTAAQHCCCVIAYVERF